VLYIRTQRGPQAVARERVNCLSCRTLGAGGTLPEHLVKGTHQGYM